MEQRQLSWPLLQLQEDQKTMENGTHSPATVIDAQSPQTVDGPARSHPAKDSTSRVSKPISVAEALVRTLEAMGIRDAFGVSGGAMATLWAALSNSPLIQVLHCRHEGGAAFAATEAHFASDRPVIVFTTAGPGITNALTGLLAARGEGAKLVLLSACTSAPQRGRWAIQETSAYTMPNDGIFTSGALFHYATVLESAEQLPQIARRLALGLAQPGSFIAHVSIPTKVQSSSIEVNSLPAVAPVPFSNAPSAAAIAHCAQLLSEGSFAIWVGFGARGAAVAIRQLAERTGAAVMCSPRGKGIFPEDHPQFVGVTGLGGHDSVHAYIQQQPPRRILVLGTRLGEPTSFWSADMVPEEGFIHVDIDPQVPGVAYPWVSALPVQSDIKVFVEALLKHGVAGPDRAVTLPHPAPAPLPNGPNRPVRPEALMAAIQRVIVADSEAIVLAESGNAFTWSTHYLQFREPGRYRVSTGVGAMGHTVTGVIGAAQGRQGKAVAIVGDGAMLMNNEISTAVKYQLPTVWIVLNDARYNMCAQGMERLGLEGADPFFPQTDFVQIARGMGAEGIRVEQESELDAALEKALHSSLPFVVDVLIDPDRLAPSKGRNQSLAVQGVQTQAPVAQQISFPLV